MTDPAIQIIAKAIEPQIDTVELVLTDPITMRKLRSERLARQGRLTRISCCTDIGDEQADLRGDRAGARL